MTEAVFLRKMNPRGKPGPQSELAMYGGNDRQSGASEGKNGPIKSLTRSGQAGRNGGKRK